MHICYHHFCYHHCHLLSSLFLIIIIIVVGIVGKKGTAKSKVEVKLSRKDSEAVVATQWEALRCVLCVYVRVIYCMY